jgi:hypothetical protein
VHPQEFAIEIRIISGPGAARRDRLHQPLGQRRTGLATAITGDLRPPGINKRPGKRQPIAATGLADRLATRRDRIADARNLSGPECRHYS